MLTITPRAWREIAALTRQQRAPAVRLARTDGGSLALDVAQGPRDDDTVVWSRGTVVYVDRQASPAVDRATLDLRDSPGARAFYLR